MFTLSYSFFYISQMKRQLYTTFYFAFSYEFSHFPHFIEVVFLNCFIIFLDYNSTSFLPLFLSAPWGAYLPLFVLFQIYGLYASFIFLHTYMYSYINVYS